MCLIHGYVDKQMDNWTEQFVRHDPKTVVQKLHLISFYQRVILVSAF